MKMSVENIEWFLKKKTLVLMVFPNEYGMAIPIICQSCASHPYAWENSMKNRKKNKQVASNNIYPHRNTWL